MKKEKEYIQIEITSSVIAAILCVSFLSLAIFVWDYSYGFSSRHYLEDHVEITLLIAFLLSILLVPITFLFSVIKAIKEFLNKDKAPLIILALTYICYFSVLFTFFF